MRARAWIAIAAVVAVAVAIAWWRHGSAGDRGDGDRARAGAASKRARGAGGVPAPASVSGRVTRADDGAPIVGAVVSLAPASASAALEMTGEQPTIVVVTGAAGAWTAREVPPGEYVVAATALGFLPASRERLAIAAGEQRAGIDLALARGGTVVRGTVSDVGGGPIANAHVVAHRDDDMLQRGPQLAAVTAADGTYQLGLPDGDYTIAASHDEYTRLSHDVVVAGKPVTVDFVLVPGGVVRGVVVARDTGKPVAGALVVAAHGHRRGSAESRARAGDDGRFAIRGLHPGTISLDAAGRGYASASPVVVELGIGESVDGVRVVVDRAFAISGRVVKKGQPAAGVAGIQLGAFSMGTGKQASALEPTDDDGAFEIVGVRPASYMLFAFGEGTVPEIGKPVEVVDRDVANVVIEMTAGATLSGRVDPPAVASIRVELAGEVGLSNMFDAMKAAIVHAESDAAGAFSLRNVPSGAFSLVARAHDGRTGKLAITVDGGDHTGLVVRLEARAAVAGTVVDSNGRAVAGVHVRAAPEKHESMSFSFGERSDAVTDADGAFRIVGLDAGKYTVSARGFEVMFSRDKDKKEKRRDEQEVELAAGEDRAGIALVVEARDGAIRGIVVDGDGKGVADAWVSAHHEQSNTQVRVPEGFDESDFGGDAPPVLTGADGKFAIERLRTGTYKLVAEGPRGASRAEQKGVAVGSTATLTLASLGTLSGNVTSAGAPVASFQLTCRGPAGSIDRSIDAPDGAYVLGHLAPGSYTCDVDADAGTAHGSVDVPSGPATLDLAVKPWATIVGTIVSALGGKPIANVGVIAEQRGGSSRGFEQLMFGGGPVSDASGRFTVERVAAGSGSLAFYPRDGGGMQPLGTKSFTVTDGQRLDVGVVKVIPPRTGDPATFGLQVQPGSDGALAVTSVTAGGPAAQAGIVVGDSIATIDGVAVGELGTFAALRLFEWGQVGAGDSVQLGLARGATVTLVAVKV